MTKFSVSTTDNDEEALLHYASCGNATKVAELLAPPFSIDPNIQKPISGLTPLHIAAQRGHADMVKILLDTLGITPDVYDSQNNTAFYYACQKGNETIIKALQPHINPNITNGQTCWTALHAAVYRKDFNIVTALLEDKRVDKHCRTSDGHSALSLLCANTASKGKSALRLKQQLAAHGIDPFKEPEGEDNLLDLLEYLIQRHSKEHPVTDKTSPAWYAMKFPTKGPCPPSSEQVRLGIIALEARKRITPELNAAQSVPVKPALIEAEEWVNSVLKKLPFSSSQEATPANHNHSPASESNWQGRVLGNGEKRRATTPLTPYEGRKRTRLASISSTPDL